MAFTAGVVALLTATAAGGYGIAKATSGKSSAAPAVEGPPKVDDPIKKATGAADQQRKRALAAQGKGSTLLTGPQGLGGIGSANLGAKTLLGL